MARRRHPVQELALRLHSTPFTRKVERRVLEFIRKRHLLTAGERVLLAVSGGPDSTALLAILSRLRGELGVQITAAHFDHMLRTREEAAADAAYVQRLAAVLEIPLACGRGDVAARSRREGQSVETAARALRYAFLRREAKARDASVVMLGHTLDDQAESVLLHIIRGSGLDGLAGMRPRSPWPFGRGPEVARPLLALGREETERYCSDAGLRPRQDPTNELLIATRNRVRHEVLPALRALNPRVSEALARLAEAAALDVDHLQAATEEKWRRLAKVTRDEVSFPRRRLSALPPALVARLVRRAVAELRDSAADLEGVHVQGVLDSLDRSRDRISLPHGLTAVTNTQSVRILRRPSGEGPPASARIAETLLSLPGRTEAGRWMIEAELVEPPPDPRHGGPLEVFLDADAVGDGLAVRSRRPGDRLRPLGLGGEKKVQDILVDAKVSAGERDGVPIVCAKWGMVWVVGHCIDERAALTASSRRALRLRCSVAGAGG